MLDQDDNFYLICLSILITCLLDNEWMLWGEVTGVSPLGVKGFNLTGKNLGHNLQYRP